MNASPDFVINTIMMLRPNSPHLSFLIVEGTTDEKAYENFIDTKKCRIVAAHSKDNAKDAIGILEAEQFVGMLAIVDADFDVLTGEIPASANILLTDTHDLETMLLQSPALEKVLTEFGSKEKIARQGKEVREVLLEAGAPIGYVRWISLQEGLNLTFEGLDFGKFIDIEEHTLVIKVSALIVAIKNKSQKHALVEQDILDRVATCQKNAHDPWHVCCGHDLIEILSLVLRKALGTNDAKDVKPDIIARSLRLAYERAFFCETRLYASMQAWERANQPFKVLAYTET